MYLLEGTNRHIPQIIWVYNMRWQKNPLFRENAGISGPPAGLAFFSSQLKAEVQKVENLILRKGTVQQNRDPVGFVHMVGRPEPTLMQQRADQDRITFDIQNIHHTFSLQTNLTSGNLQNQCIPLRIVSVPQNGVPREFHPEIFRLIPERLLRMVQNRISVRTSKNLYSQGEKNVVK